MKTEREINKRIRDLFGNSKTTWEYDSDNKMKEIAVLHWVLDDEAKYNIPVCKKKKGILNKNKR